jgi:hypothetical protein
MKTSKGDDFWAVYSANGELIETREISNDVALPHDVQVKLANSKYKDWTLVGNKEIIRFYHDHDFSSVEQHYRVTVEKDKVKRSISFNYQNKDKNN